MASEKDAVGKERGSVLIVDDSLLACKVMVKTLEPHFGRVNYLTDGRRLLETIRQHEAQCVLMDLLMPNVDGYELIAGIRQWEPDFPVIVMSADIQEKTRLRCQELGVFAFFNKPAPTDQLVAAIRRALSRGVEEGGRAC